MKKLLSLVLVLAMLVPFATFAQATEGTDWVKAPDLSGKTIKIFTDDRDWTDASFAEILPKFKQIEELTGCTIVWDVVNSDYSTVLKTRLIDPADSPDIVMQWDRTSAADIEDGWVYDISQAFDVAPNIERFFNEYRPDLKGQFTYNDGGIYTLPNACYKTQQDFNEIYAYQGDHAYWYRADIAKELGYDTYPKTLEELEELLTAVHDKYPDMRPLEFNGMTRNEWASARNLCASFGLHFNFESLSCFSQFTF